MTTHTQIYEALSNYFEKKDFVGLIEYCSSKIEFDNSNYLYFGARGKAYSNLEKYENAIIDLTRALELHANYAIGFYNRGVCYYKTGQYELAIKDLEHAKSLQDGFDIINFYLGASYSILEQNEKAIEFLSTHLADYDDEEALRFRAESYKSNGQDKEANQDFAQLLLIESRNLEAIEKINKISKPAAPVSSVANKSFEFNDIGFSFLNDIKCTGIYILEFENKEYYIGQAKKIATRVRQHYKKYHDIVNVYIKPVNEELLTAEENATICLFEQNNLRIRNLKQIEFLNIFDAHKQERWVSDINFNIVTGSKFDNAVVREKFSARYLELKNKPYFDKLVALLSKYVKRAIPDYCASEYNYWNITCLPNHLKKENCISRININTVPVLSVFEVENNSLSFMLFASKLYLLRKLREIGHLRNLFENFPDLAISLSENFEDRTEGDEIILLITQDDFQSTLDNNLLLSSMRLFNLRMMNKIGKEEYYRRTANHCLDLSDLVISKII